MESEEVALVMHVLHARQGWSISRIAREFDVNWRTARRYAMSPEPSGYGPRACPADLTVAQLAHVEQRLAVCDSIRATVLLRELAEREMPYAGSYPSFVRRVRLLREPARQVDPVVRFETDPGRQLQVDWADCGDWLVGRELVRLHALVSLLGFSRMVAVRFATDTTRPTTLRLLVDLIAELGGVPREVLTDRDPAFVVGALNDGRAVFAPEWLDLARLLDVTPRACKPRRAQTKGKVERVIRELKEDFLVWLTGAALPPAPTLNDYDQLARRWTAEVVAQRTHRTTGRVVADAWTQERGVLRTLPTRMLHTAGSASVTSTTVRSGTRDAGEIVEPRPLTDYEAAAR